jgi:hypothetical protein
LAVNTYTGSPFWFNPSLLTFTIPWLGLDREGTISMISLSTCSVSPARVGFGHAISPPKPIRPFAKGTPPSTVSSRARSLPEDYQYFSQEAGK